MGQQLSAAGWEHFVALHVIAHWQAMHTRAPCHVAGIRAHQAIRQQSGGGAAESHDDPRDEAHERARLQVHACSPGLYWKMSCEVRPSQWRPSE